MAISSSSGSNSIDYPSSPLPSSSRSSASSLDSIPESQEPTPEYNPTAAFEVLAPLHWDAEEFDFGTASEDDEPQTEGEDLQLLFQEELESSSEEGFSWDGADSSLEETYRYLHLMTTNLLNQKKLRTRGPWWFI